VPPPSAEYDDAGPPTEVPSSSFGGPSLENADPTISSRSTAPIAGLLAHQAVPVYLVRTENGVVATLTSEGIGAPDGAIEALVVALAPGIDLVGMFSGSSRTGGSSR
jgi:hypothetical protein